MGFGVRNCRHKPAFLAIHADLLRFAVSGQRQLDQFIDQGRIGNTARLPEPGIHADGRKTGHGVDLVQENVARISHKEINTSETGTVDRAKRVTDIL